MTEQPRKQPPRIDADVDIELNETTNADQHTQPIGRIRDAKSAQPEPKTWEQVVAYKKLSFAQYLIAGSLFLIVALAIIVYFTPSFSEGQNEINAAVELLKLVTTTALGFVFAKSQYDDPRGGKRG